jgi:polysaccharide biosynthesis/export protein
MIAPSLILTVVAVASLIVTGLATAQEQAKGPLASDGDYRIGLDDMLDIVVWNNTAVSRVVPVRPDGKISLPLLNDVPAAGLAPSELREALAKRLADYMPTPEVSVIVREVRSFRVSVIGEIRIPGRYELRTRTTVLDVLAQAGSFTDFASRSRIFVLRLNGATLKRIPFNYSKVIAADGEHENFVLRPGDIVVVP